MAESRARSKTLPAQALMTLNLPCTEHTSLVGRCEYTSPLLHFTRPLSGRGAPHCSVGSSALSPSGPHIMRHPPLQLNLTAGG